MNDQLPLRPNVCILLKNEKNQLFLGERIDCPEIWQFPQGGAKKKYSLEENVLRELEEEVGLEREFLTIEQQLKATHDYEWENPPEYAIGKWRGQSQTFWLVSFSGSDDLIRLDRHKPEFMSWRWCSVEQVKELAEPLRLPGYLPALEEFSLLVT